MTYLSFMRLLREFIGSYFGLDRHVTINALKDIAGGPDPRPGPIMGIRSPLGHQDSPEFNAMTRLSVSMVPSIDESSDDVENDDRLTPDA